MSFSEDLRKIAESKKALAHKLVRKIVLDVGTNVVFRSPVGDPKYWQSPPPPGYVGGRFRGNWQFGIGAINPHYDFTIDKTGQASIARFEAGLPEKAAGGIYYLTNSLPYAQALEDGHSRRQAPNGIVRLAKIQFQDTVKKVGAELGLV